MNNTDETLVCLKCNNEIEIVDGDIVDGTLEIESQMLSSMFICVKCRYFGATVKFLQWGLDSNKIGVDIMGALAQAVRIGGNLKQYLGELKVMLTSSQDRTKDISRTVMDIENLVDMYVSNVRVTIGSLEEFGK